MTTRGDQILDRALSKVGGKGLFVKELETALEDGRADLAVHSLKDVPMVMPEGFDLSCVMAREDARDAFVSNDYASLEDLPAGAIVGTSSLRRESVLRAKFPRLEIQPLRGNLDTRMGKLDKGEYQAIILAAAGLKRLGLESRIRAFLPYDPYTPAAGQGALGIETLSKHPNIKQWLAWQPNTAITRRNHHIKRRRADRIRCFERPRFARPGPTGPHQPGRHGRRRRARI